MKIRFLLLSLSLTLGFSLLGQESAPIQLIVCHHDHSDHASFVPFGRVQLRSAGFSDFVFNFEQDVPAQARLAMEYAASIWEQYLISEVPINIDVTWQSFEEENVLASAGPTTIFRDFSFQALRGVWYPVALAEAIAGRALNEEAEADIQITVNSELNWYFGTDGQVPFGRTDMVSVILHELGHGLGYISSADVDDSNQGILGFDGRTIIYDEFITTLNGDFISDLSTFQRPSSDLRTAYTSTNLFFDAPEVADFVGRNRGAELHAPRSFDSGSSISHLDEFAFRAGSENALMTPQLSFREAVHDPGPIGLGILQALGWEIAQATVTSTAQIQVENISVFPNPTRDQVRIVWPQDFPNEMNYQLYDQLGRTLLNGNITQQDQINLSQLPPGNYHLFLQSAERQFRTQIVLLE